MKRSILLLLVAALVVVLGWTAFFWDPTNSGARHSAMEGAGPPIGGEFVLNSADGPLRLSDLSGEVVLVYFGYTWCPDICPTSLALMAQAFNGMESGELEKVRGVFISVDPERDSAGRLREYTAHFHPRIIGVTGTPSEVEQVAKRYGAAYRKADSGSEAGYTVDHSSYTYVLDQDGKVREVLSHGTPPDEIRSAVRRLLNGG